ncbi:hypothetical protein ACVDG5_034335 [Mesorhizobium sp. ORM6]
MSSQFFLKNIPLGDGEQAPGGQGRHCGGFSYTVTDAELTAAGVPDTRLALGSWELTRSSNLLRGRWDVPVRLTAW